MLTNASKQPKSTIKHVFMCYQEPIFHQWQSDTRNVFDFEYKSKPLTKMDTPF